MRKTDPANPDAPRVLVVQAESGRAAEVYRIITRIEYRSIAAGELTSIKSFADLEREEKEAQAKEKEKKLLAPKQVTGIG